MNDEPTVSDEDCKDIPPKECRSDEVEVTDSEGLCKRITNEIQKLTPPKLTNDEISMVRPVVDLEDMTRTIFDRNKVKIIEENLKEKRFKYEFEEVLYLKHTDKQTITKYLNTIGEIIVNSVNFFIICHDNFIHRCYVKLSTYTDITIVTHTNDLDIKSEHDYIKQKFKDLLRPKIERISLEWGAILDGRVEFFNMAEDLDDVFYNESYPYIDIEKLSKEFYKSDSPILILLGPPGTGKTRLIRHILKYKASLNKDSLVFCVFTSDQKIIENGYIFTKFLTGSSDILVLEDIDFHLTPRTDGNTSMYHLLNISNGIASNYMKRKKIILSTNLPNINNIDEALLRPGRCFDIIKTRFLNKDESLILLKLIGKETKLENKDYPISELYNIDQKTRKITIEPKKGISKRAGF